MDLKAESRNLSEKFNIKLPYTLFAKSAGVLLGLYSTRKKLISAPSSAVFMGTPLEWADKQGWRYSNWFAPSFECLFIHNRDDPVTPAQTVKDYLNKSAVSNYKLIIQPGRTHAYDDFIALKEYLTTA